MRFQMVPQSTADRLSPSLVTDFLDLPWDQPLAEWESERLVEVTRGIHRHVVRFVHYGDDLYALKEFPRRLAEREFRLLRRMVTEEIPTVRPVGIVTDRGTSARGDGEDELDAVLITRHLTYSLPYRALFASHRLPNLRDRLLDALAGLLVRLHLANFFWGDCSLSNTLFRRDAGALAAYLVDAETAEWHDLLSNGLRRYDLDIAEENIAGELLDLAARYGEIGADPIETATELRKRYEDLWSELTREDLFGKDERYRIQERLIRLNELGFDVIEYDLETVGEGFRLRFHPEVVEPGHHRRRLYSLTGLDVQENQARRLLHDIEEFRAELEESGDRRLPESVVAYRWLSERFEPVIMAVPTGLRGKLEPAELYHEILEHRWYLSEKAGRDVGIEDAVRSYTEGVLVQTPGGAVVEEDAQDDAPLLIDPPDSGSGR